MNNPNSLNNKKINTLNLNRDIFNSKLSVLNFGNASIRINNKSFYIKASGKSANDLNLSSIVKVNYDNFKIIENKYKPSVDSKIHAEIYNKYKSLKSIIHVHSKYATILAQANIEPICLGTTHADYFNGKIPLSKKINLFSEKNYELKIAESIFKSVDQLKYFPPGILLRDHGMFSWGISHKNALDNCKAIEYICELHFKTMLIRKNKKIFNSVFKYHFKRKNIFKVYGQKK